MYHWVTDKSFRGRMKGYCSELINRLVQAINGEGALCVRQHLVGSGAKNLITQNAEEPVDLDYDLEIVRAVGFDINDCRRIKEYVRGKFNEVLRDAGRSDCRDSTSVLTTERVYFAEGDPTEFSIDLCIVKVEEAANGIGSSIRRPAVRLWTAASGMKRKAQAGMRSAPAG